MLSKLCKDAAREILGKMSAEGVKPITVKLYFSLTVGKSLPRFIKQFIVYEDYVRSLLKEYERASGGKIRLEYYDPMLSNAAGTAKWSEGDAFSGVQSSFYWSSTFDASAPQSAWRVALYDGYVASYYKTSSYYVWPVRGGL